MEKLLKLKIYVDGGINDTPFPNAEDPIEIGAFRYDAKRMGGAPTITASVDYPSCLDDVWTDNVYAEFNGEKYYLKQTPTSSYDNEDTMYKHDLELISERSILDSVYFFDTVTDDVVGDDKPVSDSTKVAFFGNIQGFVARLNSSLVYSGVGYTVVVDEGIESEEKLMSFEDQFLSNVLQEIYNTYEIPYYFDGKTIHIGFSKDVPVPTFAYGVDNALLSITKNNANYKIVNRVTGTGSSDNIPFYYPNNSPKGDIYPTPSRSGVMYRMADAELYANKVGIGDVLKYERFSLSNVTMSSEEGEYESGEELSLKKIEGAATKTFTLSFFANNAGKFTIDFSHSISNVRNPIEGSSLADDTISCRFSIKLESANGFSWDVAKSIENGSAEIVVPDAGRYFVRIIMEFASQRLTSVLTCKYSLSYYYTEGYTGWSYNGEPIELSDIGLALVYGTIESGDTITQTLTKYVKTSPSLMPSIYRNSDGAERFYNAVNGEYTDEEGNAIVFNNPYTEGRPKEHIITVEDVKPTIKGTEVNGLRIDMFSEFAYDEDDNDETYEDEEGNVYFKHPYFYGKLRVMDFNLFDHAIEQQPMTISFTSGHAGACNFEIGVTEEYPQRNPVQVDDLGNLLRDENGMVLAGVEGTQQDVTELQPRQQDTSKYEVWIALKKEESTYGILMPQEAHRPKACTEGQNDGDTFVILGINLPFSYIQNAEKEVENAIVKYMKDNNDEKFTFSIGFSRIYFEENETVLEQLSENSKIAIEYNGKTYDLYVSSFSYSMSEGDVLPEIRVELDETLKTSQNALQNAISQVKSELGRAIGNIDVLGAANPYFVRKDADDEAQGRINFKKGVKFGEGGKVEVFDDNSAKLTIEYLEVTKKASFTSLEIQEKTHVGGQILVTPAALNCGEVEELDDAYRCYFQTKGTDGDEIFNQFAVGDQAICQTFNAWGSKYYWRLVTGIGEDYIDLSKTDYDEGSDIPSAGDKIIQLGNRDNEDRQNAIVIAAYGDGSPYIIQYKGINAFELPESKVVTKLSSTENLFTGIVAMKAGSTGLSELEEFADLQVLAGEASEDAKKAKDAVDNMEVGGQNLVRNSGFTGDFLSEQLADESVLDAAAELYSAPLDHWDATGVTVQDSTESTSGKEAVVNAGTLSQILDFNILANKEYVFSFKAKGTSLTFGVGGVTRAIELTDEWARYVEKITATTTNKTLTISSESCTICEVQLEKGNTATAWSNSPLDNMSDRAYYQSLKYLNQAIEQGSTVTQGGLVLSSTINLGEWTTNETTGRLELASVLAGMNGVFGGNSANEVPAFWAGGNTTDALTTIARYLSIPTPETPSGELPYVVTHGGRVIANDAIIRGTIYAEDGEFTGVVHAKEGDFTGEVNATSGSFGSLVIDGFYVRSTTSGSVGRCIMGVGLFESYKGGTETSAAGADVARVQAGGSIGLNINNDDGFNVLATGAYSFYSKFNTAVSSEDANISYYADPYVEGQEGKAFSVYAHTGMFAGLRPMARTLISKGSDASPNVLTDVDFSINITATSGTYYVGLPSSPQDGQEYWIELRGATLVLKSEKTIYNHYNGNALTGSITNRGVIRLKYYADVDEWTMTWVDRY